jgi:hypothetical protein
VRFSLVALQMFNRPLHPGFSLQLFGLINTITNHR